MIISLTTLGHVFYGSALGVLFFRSYSFQREVLLGDNRSSALLAGANQAIMGTLLSATLRIALPALQSWSLFSAASIALSALPLVAALCAGGYAQMRQRITKSRVTFAINIMQSIDKSLDVVPRPIADFMVRNLTKLHMHLGTIYFVAQMSIFGVVGATVQPLLGMVGLGYSAVSFVRARNTLPKSIAQGLEKFNYWVGLFSGAFLDSRIMKSLTIFKIGYQLAFNVLAPEFVKSLLGNDSEFLEVSAITNAKKYPSRLDKEMSLPRFSRVLKLLPRLGIHGAAGHTLSAGTINDEVNQLVDEFNTELHDLSLFDDMSDIKRKYEEMPSEGVILQLNYLRKVTLDYAKLRYKLMQEILPRAKDFFDRKTEHRNWETSVAHMARVPKFLPAAPEINLPEFLQNIEPRFMLIAQNFRAMCLESPKFHAISTDLSARLIELNFNKEQIIEKRREEESKKRYLQKELTELSHRQDYRVASMQDKIQACDEKLAEFEDQKRAIFDEIEQINPILIDLWRKKFNLGQCSETEVLAIYIRKRLTKVCDQVKTGKDLLWDKTAGSLEQFQQMAMHLFDFCRKLLGENTPEKLNQLDLILALLAIDGGDYCATGVYDAVEQLYGEFVLNQLYVSFGHLLTPGDKIAIYLQDERQALFNQIYNTITQHPLILTLYPDTDFHDRHMRSSVTKALSVLNLKSKFNAQSDLSNQQQGFMSEIMTNFLAYFIARAIMLLETGYSPEHIIDQMSHQYREGAGVGTFNVAQCCMSWAESFNDEAILDSVSDILTSYEEGSEAKRQKLYIAMLYDLGIINCLRPRRQAAIEKVSPGAITPKPVKSQTLVFTQAAGTMALRGSAYMLQNVRDCVNYVTREETIEEKNLRSSVRGPSPQFL